MTSQPGYNNVLSATSSSHATSSPPLCNVETNFIDFVSFTEESDWSGPMLARYSGQVTAEKSCDSVVGYLSLKNSTYTWNFTQVEFTQVDDMTYTFDAYVATDNVYNYY